MQVKLTDEFKRFITLAEAPTVRAIIKEFKEDSSTAADYGCQAVRAAWDITHVRMIEASAEICKNNRIWNQYGEDSGDIDIWIKATAQCHDGFIIVGACLSDIWSLTGDNNAEVANHFYVRKFKEVK